MTQQNEKPNLIEPKEIIAFIDKQKASVQHATGLQLLRRAAETIAFHSDVIEQYKDRDQQIGFQIAEVLGEEFKQAFPDSFGFEDVLIYLAGMREQIGNLQQGILERDEIIREYESPVGAVVSADESKTICADPFFAHDDEKYADPFSEDAGLEHLPQLNSNEDRAGCSAMMQSANGMSHSEIVNNFKEFAYTMKGFVIAAAQFDQRELMRREVEGVIDKLYTL